MFVPATLISFARNAWKTNFFRTQVCIYERSLSCHDNAYNVRGFDRPGGQISLSTLVGKQTNTPKFNDEGCFCRSQCWVIKTRKVPSFHKSIGGVYVLSLNYYGMFGARPALHKLNCYHCKCSEI